MKMKVVGQGAMVIPGKEQGHRDRKYFHIYLLQRRHKQLILWSLTLTCSYSAMSSAASTIYYHLALLDV